MTASGTAHAGPDRLDERSGPAPLPRLVPLAWALAAAAVLCQVAYPLVTGSARSPLTVATVVVFFVASATSAAAGCGVRWASALVAVAAGGGLAVEALGVATGFPFGRYSYAGSLGPKLLGVPLVIPLAWAMMAYPALVVGRRLCRSRPALVPLVGGWALASWDLFLDPQMVLAGHWAWASPGLALPGLPGIPLTNFVGWFAVAVLLVGGLHLLLPQPRPAPDGRLPAVLYLWTYGSQVLANLAFFDRPAVALVGGLGMGLVAVPYAVALARSPARSPALAREPARPATRP